MNSKAIRDKLLGTSPTFKSVKVEWEGTKVEIKQPSRKDWKALVKKSTVKGEIDNVEFLTWAVIYNTYVPGTDERVFGPEHYDMIMAMPMGGFLEEFGNKALEVIVPEQANMSELEGKGGGQSKPT